jgi:hypothetical protein
VMAKAHLVGEELEKGKKEGCKECGGTGGTHTKECKAALKNPKVMEKKAMGAAGPGTGQAAGPVAPAAPAAPTATSAAPTTQQKPARMPASPVAKPAKPVTSSTVKLTRSEQARPCPECGLKQFSADHKFVGCLCFRGLCKSTNLISMDENFAVIDLSEWDRDELVTFLESVGRR